MSPQIRANARPRRPAAQPLADLVLPCLNPVLARQGFGEADVLMHWPEIVGHGLAERCRPVKLQWHRPALDRRGEETPRSATLVVRVEGAFALTLQHMAAVVIERVNVHFGWRCVDKLLLKQGPLPPASRPPKRARPLDPKGAERARIVAVGVEDDRLRAALVALGRNVLRADRT